MNTTLITVVMRRRRRRRRMRTMMPLIRNKSLKANRCKNRRKRWINRRSWRMMDGQSSRKSDIIM
jgi:hypothetical protein